MIKLLFLLFPLFAQAEYNFGVGTGAYMGRRQLQAEWISENQKHHILGIYGYTNDEMIGQINQIGMAYLWSMEKKEFDNFKWTPLLAGGFFTYTDNKKFFTESPSRYYDPDYYDMTNLRFGFRFGSELMLIRKSDKTIRISVDGTLLERAFIAFFNNTSELGIFEDFWSLGFSVRFGF
jgi:hypothetical protein